MNKDRTVILPQMSFNFNGFYQTWLLLDDKANSNTPNFYSIPWIVNGAFACEIGMKYILTQNKITFKKEHLLHELYNLLPDTHKTAISNDLYEQCPGYTLEQFNQEILLLSNSFCDFRYFYEKTLTLNTNYFRIWCQAIYKQVNTYPMYTLVERTGEPDITMDEFDQKRLRAQNDMLSELKKRNSRR